jgi:hypothetical protein
MELMAEEHFDTKRLLAFRKLTRAVTELLRGQLKAHLGALAPLLRPQAVLGNYVRGGGEVVKGADRAARELQEFYGSVAAAAPFNLDAELSLPVEVSTAALEITPVEYTHAAASAHVGRKQVVVTSPLRLTLTYEGYSPGRLAELLRDRNRTAEELRRFVLHYLLLHAVLSKKGGVAQLLEALRFPVSFEHSPEFGALPLARISCPVSTLRPPDDLLFESTELSGADAFEEVVSLDSIRQLRDPLKERLAETIKSHGESAEP